MYENYTAEQIVALTKEYWAGIYNPTSQFLIYLNRLRDVVHTQVKGTVSNFNLSTGEFDILATLRRTSPPYVLTPTELQRSVLITSGGLTKLLYQLEAHDLVSRSVQAQDKRSKLVHLTSKGKKTVERAVAAIMQAQQQWISNAFTEKELAQLNKLLGKAAREVEKTQTHQP